MVGERKKTGYEPQRIKTNGSKKKIERDNRQGEICGQDQTALRGKTKHPTCPAKGVYRTPQTKQKYQKKVLKTFTAMT